MTLLFIVLVLFVVVTLLPASQACIRFTGNLQSQGEWDDKDTPRNIVKSCECGEGEWDSHHVFISWRVASHYTAFATPIPTSKKPCLGMIVTSNMVATSHKCLTLNGTQLQPYDAWRPRPNKTKFSRVFPPTSNIIVSSSLNSSEGKIFNVRRLIINPNFALTAPVDHFSGNDLLLLVLEADFTERNEKFRPICIPASDTEVDLTGQPGIILGVNEPGFSSQTFVYEAVVPGAGVGFGMGCGARKESWVSTLDRKMDRLLCVRYHTVDTPIVPRKNGSALISKTHPPFLLGIVTNVSPWSGGGLLHLANIFPLVKYLEHHAKEAKSKWCTTPHFSLGNKVDSKILPPTSLYGPWPWTNFTPPPRDMSLDCECGKLNSGSQNASTMIVGGGTATPGEFGWMAKLRIKLDKILPDGSLYEFTCGGSVINDRMILSAAHCFAWLDAPFRTKDFVAPPENTRVFLNSHEFANDSREVEVFPRAVYIHHGYIGGDKKGQTVHDVALLILKSELRFPSGNEDGLRPVCLPKFRDNRNWIGRTATVAGWGLTGTANDSKLADQLQKLDLPIVKMSDCEKAAGGEEILDGFLCAGTLDPQKDSAPGDSGGPLMVKNANGRYDLAGLVSYGIPAGPKTAALYTDVQKTIQFVDYYANQVGAKYCKS